MASNPSLGVEELKSLTAVYTSMKLQYPLAALFNDYRILVNRTYNSKTAVSEIVEKIDAKLKSSGFSKYDTLERIFDKDDIERLICLDARDFKYRTSFGRRIDLSTSPYINEEKTILQVDAQWSLIPFFKKELFSWLRQCADPWSSSDVSSEIQKLTEQHGHAL